MAFVPPQKVRNNARKGLELRRKHGRGGLSTQEAGAQGIGSGVARAASLANGDAISLDTVKRMVAFFGRHQKNKDSRMPNGEPGAGMIAWLLWGGDAGRVWAEAIVRREGGKTETLKHLQGQHDQSAHAHGGAVNHTIPDHVRGFHQEISGRAKEIAKKHGLPDALEGVYLVGSQAKGTARPHSDVDFLVKTVPFHEYHARKGGR